MTSFVPLGSITKKNHLVKWQPFIVAANLLVCITLIPRLKAELSPLINVIWPVFVHNLEKKQNKTKNDKTGSKSQTPWLDGACFVCVGLG